MDIYLSSQEHWQEKISSAQAGDTLYFSAGIYRFTQPIPLSGKQRIRFCGTEGTIFSGSLRIEGEWKRFDGEIFCQTLLPDLDIQQLYLNGTRCTMARYPNRDENQRLEGYAEDALSPERIARWKNPAGGYIRGLHSAEWGGNSYIIDGKSPDGTLQYHWVGDNNRGGELHETYRCVENIFEELDAPGEWFYEKKSGILYLLPEDETAINHTEAEAAVCEKFFELCDCSEIVFDGIAFEKSKRTLFSAPYEKITRSDWSIARTGGITMTNCEGITVQRCTFHEIGGNCIFLDGKNQQIRIENCDFTDCGASGVCSFGKQDCVRDLSTWEYHHTVIDDKKPGPAKEEYPRDITVKDCYFYNLGIFEKQSAPVSISVSARVSVLGCTMHHLPRAGLNVCDGSFGGHRFADNLVFDTVRETGDHGPFNSWGRDRFWSLGEYDTGGNHGQEKRPYALLDATDTTVIEHNMFCGVRGFGIDLDDGSSNYRIEKNYCVGVGIKLREGFLRTVRNNFLLDAPLDLHCTFVQNDDVIENNIVVCQRPLHLIYQHEGYTTRVEENLFVGADSELSSDPFFLRGKNYILPANASVTEIMRSNVIQFEPIALEFGRADRPKPSDITRVVFETVTEDFFGATITNVDDSVRTMAGLPNYDGAYVTEISQESPLYAMGLRQYDVIVAINDRPITAPQKIDRWIPAERISVIRAQKPLLLTK